VGRPPSGSTLLFTHIDAAFLCALYPFCFNHLRRLRSNRSATRSFYITYNLLDNINIFALSWVVNSRLQTGYPTRVAILSEAKDPSSFLREILLSPLQSALTICDAVTPLDSALTKNCRVAYSFFLSRHSTPATRHFARKFFPCRTSRISPATPLFAAHPKTPSRKSVICRTCETPSPSSQFGNASVGDASLLHFCSVFSVHLNSVISVLRPGPPIQGPAKLSVAPPWEIARKLAFPPKPEQSPRDNPQAVRSNSAGTGC
jgi:hypothetical protein